MNQRQVIWVTGDATSYAGVCEACLDELPTVGSGPLAYRSAKVAGSLRADADVGFARCARGHSLSLRRMSRRPQVARPRPLFTA
jgi:hypothetical protein